MQSLKYSGTWKGTSLKNFEELTQSDCFFLFNHFGSNTEDGFERNEELGVLRGSEKRRTQDR